MTAWQPLPASYQLPEGEVHVVRVTLEAAAAHLVRLRAILSGEERARADRFYFEVDRARFTIGRALSRLILGHCLGRPAEQLTFVASSFGKPHLKGDAGIDFNVSHSGAIVLLAFARGRELGVDVERIRTDMASAEIAERFFSAQECRELASLSEAARGDAFFACWTRKEAYIKAVGNGLSLPLDQFDVAFLPGEAPRLVATRHDPSQAARWTLRNLDPGEGHKGALAAEGADWTLRCWDWRGEFVADL
jgi:4'-phosphopantetheinyl transferase